ncbi:MAG: hypothetical protein MZV70_69675 [Desulfobacterales bacterium]|nr:hypothetical protein [Desulfobacterales bacterium]
MLHVLLRARSLATLDGAQAGLRTSRRIAPLPALTPNHRHGGASLRPQRGEPAGGCGKDRHGWEGGCAAQDGPALRLSAGLRGDRHRRLHVRALRRGGGGISPRLKTIVGSLNGGSMCFVFYATSTASVIERLASPERRPSGGGILALTRAFNAGLFAMGLPVFIATSLVAASLGGGIQGPGRTVRLLASLAVPVTTGSVLFIRADKRISSLRGAAGKEFVR